MYPASLSFFQSKVKNEGGVEANGITVIAVTLTVIGVLQGAIGFNKNSKTKQKQSSHWTFIPSAYEAH